MLFFHFFFASLFCQPIVTGLLGTKMLVGDNVVRPVVWPGPIVLHWIVLFVLQMVVYVKMHD